MNTILLATHNRDKAREFREILGDLGIELLTLDTFPLVGPVTEDGLTLEENALKKAVEVHRQTGLASLADDTGLEVRYLNDAPGVYSSRFAGPGASYADNVRKLLAQLRGVPPRRRGARFRTVLAFVPASGQHELAEGAVRGVIVESPRGGGGFGYDPIFLPDGFAETYAEMTTETKNRISHRARAGERMKDVLKKRLMLQTHR
jgi:XTP/dITP diphosphohydrolase